MNLKNSLFNKSTFFLVGFVVLSSSLIATISNSSGDSVFENVKEKYEVFCQIANSYWAYYEKLVYGDENHPKLTKYDIKITSNSNAIDYAYSTFGVIPLRDANNSESKILILGCGNRAKTKYHTHEGSHTVDCNLRLNPSVIINLEKNALGLRYFKDNKYDVVIIERVGAYIFSKELFKQIGRILTPDGTLVMNFKNFDIYSYIIDNKLDRALYPLKNPISHNHSQVTLYFNNVLNYPNVSVINLMEFYNFNSRINNKWFNLSGSQLTNNNELKSKVTLEYWVNNYNSLKEKPFDNLNLVGMYDYLVGIGIELPEEGLFYVNKMKEKLAIAQQAKRKRQWGAILEYGEDALYILFLCLCVFSIIFLSPIKYFDDVHDDE